MNILYPVPVGLNGVSPQVRSLNAHAESLSTIMNPGFLNAVLSAGNQIDPSDILVVNYANGTQLFTQQESNGVITLVVYDPGNNNFPFTNVQFVAKGGSDLNAGNTFSAPKLTIPAAISAVTTGGLVWVLDSGVYENQFITMPPGVTLYAPTAFLVVDAVSGSLITQLDTGMSYVSYLYAQNLEASGGANLVTQNGALSGLLINAIEAIGPCTFNGTVGLEIDVFPNSALTFTATGVGFLNVGVSATSTITITTPDTVHGKFGDTFYGTQTFIDQVISQQQQTQETVGRTLIPSDSNTTVSYMNTVTGNYSFPATGIPVGTKISFVQLSSGVVQFNSDGFSTILSTVSAPVITNGVNAKGYAEQISLGVWIIDGNVISGGV